MFSWDTVVLIYVFLIFPSPVPIHRTCPAFLAKRRCMASQPRVLQRRPGGPVAGRGAAMAAW